MLHNRIISITFGILVTAADDGLGVLGFSPASRKPTRASPMLPVATIDAAELFDGSFFRYSNQNDDDAGLDENSCVEINLDNVDSVDGEVKNTSHAASADVAIEGIISSTSLGWAAIGAILSLSVALNTRAIFGSSLRLISAISSWYLTRLEIAPLLTKCITGGIIALIGDYGAQWFEYKSLLSRKLSNGASLSRPLFSIRGTYNFRRGMARFLECLLVSSPLMHYGYDLFESIMPVVGGAGIYRSFAALTHVLADCVFLDGIFVFTGIVFTGLLEGHSLRKHVLPNVRNMYLPTFKASVITSGALMPLQFLSFRFLPVHLRVLSVNAVDLIWTGVVSFVSHSGADVECSH